MQDCSRYTIVSNNVNLIQLNGQANDAKFVNWVLIACYYWCQCFRNLILILVLVHSSHSSSKDLIIFFKCSTICKKLECTKDLVLERHALERSYSQQTIRIKIINNCHPCIDGNYHGYGFNQCDLKGVMHWSLSRFWWNKFVHQW